MHIAVAVGTLLLGGWVLNSPVDEDDSAVQEQSRPSGTTPAVLPSRSDMQGTGEEGAGRSGGQAGGRSMMGSQGGRTQQQQRQGPMMMPSSPTDSASSGPADMTGQPMAPTSSGSTSQGSGGGMGSPGGMPSFGSRRPVAPTERQGASSQFGYRPMSGGGMTDPNRRMQTLSSPAVTAPPVTDKAFSGYRTPSGVSPYMNLFRPTTGGVDNYTTLVRPELEQRFLNRQLGNDIRGLQNSTRTQGMNLQQLNKDSRTLQGVGTPQYYQNYGNYYQGYGQ